MKGNAYVGIALAITLTTACSSSDADCEAAVKNLAKVMVNHDHGYPENPDKYQDEKTEKYKDMVERGVLKKCQTNWSKDLINCQLSVRTTNEMVSCSNRYAPRSK